MVNKSVLRCQGRGNIPAPSDPAGSEQIADSASGQIGTHALSQTRPLQDHWIPEPIRKIKPAKLLARRLVHLPTPLRSFSGFQTNPSCDIHHPQSPWVQKFSNFFGKFPDFGARIRISELGCTYYVMEYGTRVREFSRPRAGP